MRSMRSKAPSGRGWYALCFVLLFAAEVMIALFVRDRFVRPYGGDVLVTVLICCFVRIFFPEGFRALPLAVFAFAAAVEVGQYFDLVSRLGLAGNTVLQVALGSTFSWADIVCYAAGCALFFLAERCAKTYKKQKSLKKT